MKKKQLLMVFVVLGVLMVPAQSLAMLRAASRCIPQLSRVAWSLRAMSTKSTNFRIEKESKELELDALDKKIVFLKGQIRSEQAKRRRLIHWGVTVPRRVGAAAAVSSFLAAALATNSFGLETCGDDLQVACIWSGCLVSGWLGFRASDYAGRKLMVEHLYRSRITEQKLLTSLSTTEAILEEIQRREALRQLQ